jgi:hypothetical protein
MGTSIRGLARKGFNDVYGYYCCVAGDRGPSGSNLRMEITKY